MEKYLLDTDVCISILKKQFGVQEKVKKVGSKNCCVSEITIAELFYGASKSENPKHFKDVSDIMNLFEIIPIFQSLKIYGSNRAYLEKIGKPMDNMDLLIGSTAVQNNYIMVTGNTKHYERIPNIKLENWIKR